MPSMSEACSPESRIALRTAQVPSARVVLFEPLVYVVSPTPTIAYLSRKYFGVVASTSCLGNGIGVSLLLVQDTAIDFALLTHLRNTSQSLSARCTCFGNFVESVKE